MKSWSSSPTGEFDCGSVASVWVAYASRLLVAVSHRNELFPSTYERRGVRDLYIHAEGKVRDGEATFARTRDACATQNAVSTFYHGSKLQRVDVLDVRRAPGAVERDDDGEADRDFGRRHRDDEKHEDLSVIIGQP